MPAGTTMAEATEGGYSGGKWHDAGVRRLMAGMSKAAGDGARWRRRCGCLRARGLKELRGLVACAEARWCLRRRRLGGRRDDDGRRGGEAGANDGARCRGGSRRPGVRKGGDGRALAGARAAGSSA